MPNIETLTNEAFEAMPLVTEGESKEVRYAGQGEVVIRLKPTVYSYTHNRSGMVDGTDELRLEAIGSFLPVLEAAGIRHTYRAVTSKWILSQLVMQPGLDGETSVFMPTDLTNEEIEALPKAPPIEVVVKKRHTGTPKHRYYEFERYLTRSDHPTIPTQTIASDSPYPETVVRFDWRNPMKDDQGNRLADEVLPEEMADWFINTDHAKKTARVAFMALSDYLESRGLELWDICFFVTADGDQLFGEVSPDCMRVRAGHDESLDKDVWRQGGSSERLLEKWQQFVKIIGD